jgi:hypothetical protein
LIGKNCKRLLSLDIKGCKRVSDRGVQALSEGCCELESLSVSNCDTLTDASLKKVAAHCHSLR